MIDSLRAMHTPHTTHTATQTQGMGLIFLLESRNGVWLLVGWFRTSWLKSNLYAKRNAHTHIASSDHVVFQVLLSPARSCATRTPHKQTATICGSFHHRQINCCKLLEHPPTGHYTNVGCAGWGFYWVGVCMPRAHLMPADAGSRANHKSNIRYEYINLNLKDIDRTSF